MSKLKELLAKQKAEKEGKSPEISAAPSTPTQVNSQKPAASGLEKLKNSLGGLGGQNKPAGVLLSSPAGKLAGSLAATSSRQPVSGKTPANEVSLQSSPTQEIAAAKAEKKRNDEVDNYQFDGQAKELGEDVLQAFVENIKAIRANIDDKAVIGDLLKFQVLHMKKHPFLADVIKPEHIQLMVRAMRISYGTVIAKKGENRSKRAAKSAEVEKWTDMIADLGF